MNRANRCLQSSSSRPSKWPVMPEVAGSSPVAPALTICLHTALSVVLLGARTVRAGSKRAARAVSSERKLLQRAIFLSTPSVGGGHSAVARQFRVRSDNIETQARRSCARGLGEIRVRDPLLADQPAAEIARDRRQRDVHDRAVDRRDRRAQDCNHQRQALPATDPGVSLAALQGGPPRGHRSTARTRSGSVFSQEAPWSFSAEPTSWPGSTT
jgi:hypothetical protein